MGVSDSPSPWASLPASIRSAGIIALATAVVAGSLLYRAGFADPAPDADTVADRPGNLARPGPGDPDPTPEPTPAPPSRSRAVLTAPDNRPTDPEEVSVPPFPTFGGYIYRVEGSEQANLMGSRTFPSEARLRVHRPASIPGGGSLESDEVLFDLHLGSQHSASEVIAFREEGLLLTRADRSITFGSSGSSERSTFDPAIPQIPVPLSVGSIQRGTSQARSPGGSTQGNEEWTVHIRGQEDLRIMGENVATWVIVAERRTRGGDESFTRTRTYWLDPVQSIWVQWEDETRIQRGFAIGGFNYQSSYKATLDRIEAL